VASVAVANAASALDEYPDQGTEQKEHDSGAISLSGELARWKRLAKGKGGRRRRERRRAPPTLDVRKPLGVQRG
jgi:hypothetical protein